MMVLSFILTKWKIGHSVIFVLLLFMGGGWVFLLLAYFPQQANIAELKGQLERDRRNVQMLEAFSIAYPSPEKYIGELKEKRTAVDKMLPDGAELGGFILAAQQAAADAGVQLLQIKPMPPVNKEGYQEIPVEILIRGSFFTSTAFLRKVEEGPRFSLIQNISVLSRQGGLESKLNLVIFSSGSLPVTVPSVQGKSKP